MNWSRNPYFIGINSAIIILKFYLKILKSRNPYFIGINSAMKIVSKSTLMIISRNPYFIGINSAIYVGDKKMNNSKMSQSLFYWN